MKKLKMGETIESLKALTPTSIDTHAPLSSSGIIGASSAGVIALTLLQIHRHHGGHSQSSDTDNFSEALVYLIARELSSMGDRANKSIYDAGAAKPSKGKRPLENVEEEFISRKFFNPHMKEETEQLSNANSSIQDDANQPESSSLISQIGPDASIKCIVHCSRSDYGSIASVNRGFRSLIRSGDIYQLRVQAGIVEHWVYFSWDPSVWEAFDPIRRRWMHLPDMVCSEFFKCSDKESLAVGTELLVFGKEIGTYLVYKYSLLTNSWSSGTRPNTPRCLFASGSLGNIAIIAGGCDLNGIMRLAELYNSETGTWVPIPNMNKPRKMCSGVFMDGKFYVVGGIGIGTGPGNSNELTCAEVYNLDTMTWTVIDNMWPNDSPAGPKAPPLIAVVRNELYAAHYAEHQVRKYDKQRNLWVPIGRLPDAASSVVGWGLAFRACGDHLLVIGGRRSSCGMMGLHINSWIPDDATPQWNLLARKGVAGFVYNCAVMGC